MCVDIVTDRLFFTGKVIITSFLITILTCAETQINFFVLFLKLQSSIENCFKTNFQINTQFLLQFNKRDCEQLSGAGAERYGYFSGGRLLKANN